MTSTTQDTTGFRRYLYAPTDPRLAELKGLDAYAYREAAKADPFTGGLITGWQPLYPSEFVGVTDDGNIQPDLYRLAPALAGEEAPTEAMVAAAEKALSMLTPEQAQRFRYAADAVEWQSWANPEFMQHDTGLRLEALQPEIREAMLELVDASFSAPGSALARTLMRINGYLGELVELPGIMNEFSYNVALYGTPSLESPWGWQLFGHHLAMNCLVIGTQMVVTPVFFGAEPDQLDDGITAPRHVFHDRIEHGRALMMALTEEQRERATVFRQMVDPAMPEGRVHPGDERHLAGAFQDNRVIPLEGIRVAELSEQARALVRVIVADFTAYLPEGPAAARRREIADHLDDTWFSWIGGHGPQDVFYFRLQSPVVVLELDHHCGVFLRNDHPEPFHIHTVMRTPNGNDYGRALLRQYEERARA
jgi:hypothetical protein